MSTSETENLLRQGIAAAKQGDGAKAQEFLLRVTELDEKNELAWLWLSGVLDNVDDRMVCLENVLAINPENSAAARGLRLLQATLPPAQPPDVESQPEEPPTAWLGEESEGGEPSLPADSSADVVADDLEDDVLVCAQCGEPNALWRVTCSACLMPLREDAKPEEEHAAIDTTSIGQAEPEPEEVDLLPEVDQRPQGRLTLVAAWIAAMFLNRRGAYEYEIFSASVGRTIFGIILGGVGIPLVGGLLLALVVAAGDFSTLLERVASLGESLTLVAWGAAALTVGMILGFYIWSAALYLIAWPLGGKASFVVHAQLLSVAFAASSLLTSVFVIIGGALWAFVADSAPAAGWIGTLGLPLLGLLAGLWTLAMNGQAVSVAHRFSWFGGLGIVILTALVIGLLSVILTAGATAYTGTNPLDYLHLPTQIPFP